MMSANGSERTALPETSQPGRCGNTSGAPSLVLGDPDPVRLALGGVTLLAVICLAVASAILLRIRDEKTGRGGRMNLLFVSIVGCFLLYVEILLDITPPTKTLCTTRMWFRHEGFTLCVLSLLMLQYRVYYSVQHGHRSTAYRDQTSVQAMLVLIAFGTVLLLVRTIFIPELPLANQTGHVVGCTLNVGSYIHIVGEGVLGGVLLYFCVHSRHSQCSFNDCYISGIVAYNSLTGTALDTVYRGLGNNKVWEYAEVVSSFYRVHALATTVLVLIVRSRVRVALFPEHEIVTTISSVSARENTHRLSIVSRSNEDIKTVTCYPCGPTSGVKSRPSSAAVEDIPGTPERRSQCAGYTEAEIDRLVSLYNAQKQEIKLLHRLLHRAASEEQPARRSEFAGNQHLMCGSNGPLQINTPCGHSTMCGNVRQAALSALQYGRGCDTRYSCSCWSIWGGASTTETSLTDENTNRLQQPDCDVMAISDVYGGRGRAQSDPQLGIRPEKNYIS